MSANIAPKITVPLNNNLQKYNSADNIGAKNNTTDLPKLGRRKSSGIKKSVSFSNTISVTDVENWKKYNKDMSEETEFYKLKKEVEEFKAMRMRAKKLKEQDKDKCCCNLF